MVRALLVNIARQLLNLEVIETLMHEQVDADNFIELVDSQAPNSLKNSEENDREDGAPGYDAEATQELSFNHLETTCVDKSEVFVKDADGEATPST